MHKKLFNALYIINIVAEAFFTLLIPAALFWGIAWLLVAYASAPDWIYAPAIVLGVLLGFYMMVKFILTAMAALERLEKEQKQKEKTDLTKAESAESDENNNR